MGKKTIKKKALKASPSNNLKLAQAALQGLVDVGNHFVKQGDTAAVEKVQKGIWLVEALVQENTSLLQEIKVERELRLRLGKKVRDGQGRIVQPFEAVAKGKIIV